MRERGGQRQEDEDGHGARVAGDHGGDVHGEDDDDDDTHIQDDAEQDDEDGACVAGDHGGVMIVILTTLMMVERTMNYHGHWHDDGHGNQDGD